MTTPVTPVADAALPLPDPADLGTWGARMAEMHRWMREDLRTGMNTLGDQTYTNALASSSIANFMGSWSSLTGALAIPASVAHGGKLWLLLSSVADVTAETPGVSASWQDVTPLAAADVVPKVGGAARIPNWVTGGRPASPVVGDEGFNTTLGCKEQWDGSDWVQEGWQYGPVTSLNGLTAQSFTGIPSWVNELVINFNIVSSSTTTNARLRLGHAGGLLTTGYQSASVYTTLGGSIAGTGLTTGVFFHAGTGIVGLFGQVRLLRATANIWSVSALLNDQTVGVVNTSGWINVTAPLTQLELALSSGTFDASCSVNLAWRK